jgi:hypothetical protein
MTTVIQKPMVNNKELRIVATAAFNEKYGGLETVMYVKIVLSVLAKYPVDMLVFEMADESHLQVRLSGYDFRDGTLCEQTVAYRTESLPTDTFWFKIDDYGDYYVGTFLFPDDY